MKINKKMLIQNNKKLLYQTALQILFEPVDKAREYVKELGGEAIGVDGGIVSYDLHSISRSICILTRTISMESGDCIHNQVLIRS